MFRTLVLLQSLIGTAMSASVAAWASNQPPESLEPLVRLDKRVPYLHRVSDLSVGNKGEERIQVSVEPRCNQAQWVYDHAELVVHRNRFGAAQFIALPTPGCFECESITVRWYHEPTGHLDFSVNVFRRLVFGSCCDAPADGKQSDSCEEEVKE